MTGLPIAINIYEITVNLLTFDYSYMWTSAAAGGAFAVYWIIMRLYIELSGSEDLETIKSEKSQGAFIYYIMPGLGEKLGSYIFSNLLIFGGL